MLCCSGVSQASAGVPVLAGTCFQHLLLLPSPPGSSQPLPSPQQQPCSNQTHISSNPATYKTKLAATLQQPHTHQQQHCNILNQTSSTSVACNHTPTPADWTAGLPRPLCIDVRIWCMDLGVHAQLTRCNYSCNKMLGMPGKPCLGNSSEPIIFSGDAVCRACAWLSSNKRPTSF